MALLHPRISGIFIKTGNTWVEEGHVTLYSLVYDVILRKINLTCQNKSRNLYSRF